MMATKEKWVSMKEAAEELNISPSRVSRLAEIGAIQTKSSIINRKIKLVNVEEIRRLLESGGIEND